MAFYFIADQHFGHQNIIKFDNRPFTSVEEMNETMIERWNARVKPEDTVCVLGDMFWCLPKDALPMLRRLKGRKRLILGNHDHHFITTETRKHFEVVKDIDELYVDSKHHVFMCHYPLAAWKHQMGGSIHLYGHVHVTKENDLVNATNAIYEANGHPCKRYNVGAMMPWMDYTPRTIEEIENYKPE